MKYAIFATEDEALKVCQRIDASLGYPKIEQGEQGPPVLTERWATPIEMADGTWAVPMLPEHRAAAKVAAKNLVDRDLLATMKVRSEL